MKKALMSSAMTKAPYIADRKMAATKAEEFMESHNIRHMPVIEGGEIVGLVDDAIVKVAKSFKGPGTLLVEDVMDRTPLTVPEGSSLTDVVKALAETKRTCAVVFDDDRKIVGIFTLTDCLNLLTQMIEKSRDNSPHEIPYESFPQYMSW